MFVPYAKLSSVLFMQIKHIILKCLGIYQTMMFDLGLTLVNHVVTNHFGASKTNEFLGMGVVIGWVIITGSIRNDFDQMFHNGTTE